MRQRKFSEEENILFINVWTEHFHRLMKGGMRNTPIYHAIAAEFNSLVPTIAMTGTEVKAKIGNLTVEYRKRKKEQGKTGCSPSTWRYFDMVDKLLGN
jgi:hypothetical protein